MSQIIVQVKYINTEKKVYININNEIGLILYDLLAILNLLIYNIEYSEFIFDDGSNLILGKTEEEYTVKLKKHIDDRKAVLKNIIIHDRRRDENMNVIKENIYIDNYIKWLDSYEEAQDNRYANLNQQYTSNVNSIFNNIYSSYMTNRRAATGSTGSLSNNRLASSQYTGATGSLATGSLATGSLATGSLATGSLATGSLATGSLATGSLDNNELDIDQENNEDMDANNQEENISSETKNDELENEDDEMKEDFFENNINYNVNSLHSNNTRRAYYNNINSQRTLDNYLINVVYGDIEQQSTSDSINTLSNFFDNLVNSLNTQLINQESVIVCLTDEEFNNLNKDSWSSEKYKYNDCTVCGDNFKDEQDIIILPCEHIYHNECIEPWLCKNSNKCPVCRKEVAKGRPLL